MAFDEAVEVGAGSGADGWAGGRRSGAAQFPAAPPIQSYEGDPGQLGDPASWRNPEFLRDNGMISIGALFLTGNDTWHGKSAVLAGKLSVVGSHASSIDVRGGTLGGSGTVAGSIDLAGGVLQPGLAPQEAQSIGASAGNVLNVGGDVTVHREAGVAVTIRGAADCTSVQADGDLALDGELTLDVQGALARETCWRS